MYATCTFNLTCNHRRHILHTTRGGPGHWNNRTMVRFDTFLTSVQYGSILDDNDFGVRISTTWISLSGDLSFSHQEKNLGLNLKFPKRFLKIFLRDLTLSSILIIYWSDYQSFIIDTLFSSALSLLHGSLWLAEEEEGLNSLTAMSAHERPLFNKLL